MTFQFIVPSPDQSTTTQDKLLCHGQLCPNWGERKNPYLLIYLFTYLLNHLITQSLSHSTSIHYSPVTTNGRLKSTLLLPHKGGRLFIPDNCAQIGKGESLIYLFTYLLINLLTYSLNHLVTQSPNHYSLPPFPLLLIEKHVYNMILLVIQFDRHSPSL